MPDNSILDLTTEEYDNFESQIIGLLREARPELDLRIGTAIRDLLVRTAAQTSGVVSKDISDLRAQMSFKLLSENPDLATDDVVESLASNYGVTRRAGVAASGYVSVQFQRRTEIIIPTDYRLRYGEYEYGTTQVWKIRTTPTADDELPIYTAEDGTPFVIVPFQATEVGSAGNIDAGQSMEILDDSVLQVASAVSYSDISGGEDQESVTDLLDRVSESFTHRELTSSAAITTRLKNEYAEVRQVSVTGFGDEEQLRDKHNVFGVSVGSRVDVWLKTFTEPELRTVIKTASKVSDGVYTFTLTPDELGVIYKVNSVNSPESLITVDPTTGRPTLGTYPFTETRSLYNSSSIAHDISSDEDQALIETAYTKWQSVTVVVTDVGPAASGEPYPSTLSLRVDAYVAPQVDAIQSYLDDDDNRNREADILARGAVPAFVELSIPVYRRSSASIDVEGMRIAITNYVNTKEFGDDLTLSQLASILHQYDILKVGTKDSDLIMTATIRAADGSEIVMTGSELNVDDVADPSIQVTGNTTVFMADLSDVYIVEKVI